jgi:hypothetical protein
VADISNAFLAALTGKTIKRADSSTDDELRLEFDTGERVTLIAQDTMDGGAYFCVLESTL